MQNKYGHFSQDALEFIITRPDTPAPWVNYISNGKYHGLVSHTGGGYSFYVNPRDNRITRWRYNSLPADRPGRYVVLRDRQSGSYWSPTWQPTCVALEQFECRHGLYYSRIASRYQKIRAEVLYFVPADDLELWQVTVRNEDETGKTLDIFAYEELCLGHALVDLINQPNDQHFNEVYFDHQSEILYATKRYWVKYRGATVQQANEAWDKLVFFAASLPIKSYDGSREQFIGRWRSESNPIAVESGGCSNSAITAGDAEAALHMELVLQPGEAQTFTVMLGVVPKDEADPEYIVLGAENCPGDCQPMRVRRHRASKIAAEELVRKYRNPAEVAKAFAHLQEKWRTYLAAVRVATPDDEMNILLNVWNQYQTSVTFQFSRDASYYHGGLLFGRGYRDSCQDTLGPLMTHPEWVRERLLEMTGHQFRDGSTFHLYYPLTGGGEKTGHSDTPLWLPLAIMEYIKETGELAFLSCKVPFHDADEATVFEHLLAAIEFTLANLTHRNLAKFGPGDWNDTLDYLGRAGKGESVWVTMFLAYILRETIELCDFIGETKKAERYRKEYQKIEQALNTHCWDGSWYIRGTNDQGAVIGSGRNAEGKIFLNTQSWAVISGIARGERALRCMDAVQQYLETPKGPKILHPAYTQINPNIGLATRCVPGKKENGAVFNHPVSWAILAECLLGRGDRAFEIYKKAQPMNPVIDIDRYQVEPYVYAEYVTSPDHPLMGQASHSWLTGSSTWMLRDGIDYILGVRPTYRGLQIEPCIPKAWRGYEVVRRFRGIYYHIKVANPTGVCRGVKSLRLEGEQLPGNQINLDDEHVNRLLANKTKVAVEVMLG